MDNEWKADYLCLMLKFNDELLLFINLQPISAYLSLLAILLIFNIEYLVYQKGVEPKNNQQKAHFSIFSSVAMHTLPLISRS